MARQAPIELKDKIHIKRRLAKVYESLLKRNVIEDFNDLASQLDINKSTVRGAFSIGSPYLSMRFLDRLLAVYGDYFSREWLLKGEGAMRAKIEVIPEEARKERWMRVAHVVQQEGMPIPEFAKAIGIGSPSTIYRILQNKTKPSNTTLNLILDRFPEYGRSWLLHGKGEAYIKPPKEEGTAVSAQGNAIPFKVENLMEFAIIPDAAAAGRLTGYGDPNPEGLETMTLPVERMYKGNYYIFTVRGASMDDGSTRAICEGDKLLCREVAREYWSAGLHYHTWPYFVFATQTEGIVVKEVVSQDLERDIISCHSINPDYPDLELHLRDIVGIYNVVELLGRSMKR
ncbi:helix-turn-helix transcriptional regulator [Porphyromonas levii]|uniref:XRE family transcriptional regulator n=1 Tax=Porphyromonas levii TaxID=28114 RepID=A0A4Y8WN43_9PORP|nr:helix-turn-helix transcriptional regulator [Porphyromonas levii]MBR8702738.1 hypothetical protein [Porphyromonas levii]MBR8713019.1 hypothetical protein [Porphyromonas levii]MBR8715066.1 hypothetical protein [Porphyromonas levii]MBR8727570.1 hypothetical protein [Porphyromonas levii]MBR8730069.1 hypothetical protein [Porphyromonas levii]